MFIIILALIVAVLHFGIMFLEMSGQYKRQSKSFGIPIDFVKLENTQKLLKNMGVYNGSLGLVIILSVVFIHSNTLSTILSLLMVFIFIVGIYGGYTVTKKIYYIQAVPALFTFIIVQFLS